VASFVAEHTILLGTFHSAMIGLVPGTMHWVILRQHIEMAARWILATVLGSPVGGAIGLGASFAVGQVVSFSIGFEWENVDAIFRVVSLAFFGAVFGMLSGGLLVWSVRHPRRDAAARGSP
jgi:hypothetical protein